MQLCHVMKPNKDVALLARIMWQLYLQGTQMVLQRLYMLSCRNKLASAAIHVLSPKRGWMMIRFYLQQQTNGRLE